MPFEDYPESFPSHSRPGARVYRIRRDRVVCDSGALPSRMVLATFPAEGLSIAALPQVGPMIDETRCRPVYAFADDDTPAIPTGRVFVTVAGDVDIASSIGSHYSIESRPPYASNAAWLVARDGTIACALSNLEALMAADGIESVEPQMLRPVATRASD